MAGICCGVVGESEASAAAEPSSRATRRLLLEPAMPFKFLTDVAVPIENGRKRPKIEAFLCNVDGGSSAEILRDSKKAKLEESSEVEESREANLISQSVKSRSDEESKAESKRNDVPRFGFTSVCGRRRDMEDTVTVEPYFLGSNSCDRNGLHLFGIFDGHGCSHVAMKCKQRLHEIVKEEMECYKDLDAVEWSGTMSTCYRRMDKEVQEWTEGVQAARCRCELQTPKCDAVGSTAVVAVVTPDKIIVSNCGDSRAVLCRKGVAIPLSSDHKPDRPDELNRIQEAGGRVIYWDGPRVLGVLAMSRAIGDSYLKPYVIPDPEVTITDRSPDDECLIIASDGLWDVVSNDTACCVARNCLRAQKPPSPPRSPGSDMAVGAGAESSDKACSDASILLTKLALARHSSDNVSVVVVDLRRGLDQHENP